MGTLDAVREIKSQFFQVLPISFHILVRFSASDLVVGAKDNMACSTQYHANCGREQSRGGSEMDRLCHGKKLLLLQLFSFEHDKDSFQFELPQLPGQMWLQVVEQSLLVILIMGRWLLPKGRITRDELSQLLLAYLAISADIVELFNLFQEREVRMNLKLSLMVLAFWTVSLVQFPFVITTVKSQKARFCFSAPVGDPFLTPVVAAEEAPDGGESGGTSSCKEPSRWRVLFDKVCDVRVWGILSTILLQDLPFWILRIYLIFWQNVMSYTMFFFICKNSLIMWVQIYRLIIICGEQRDAPSTTSQQANEMPPPANTLHPLYKPAFVSPEKKQQQKQPRDEGAPNPALVGTEDEKKQEQNGDGGFDPRRPSLNITGSVSARDLLAKNKDRRNTLGTAGHLKGSLLRKKKKPQEKDRAASIVVPEIKLASPDAMDDV